MVVIKFSEAFMKKAGIELFAKEYRRNFVNSIVYYCIDSNERKAVDLSMWYREVHADFAVNYKDDPILLKFVKEQSGKSTISIDNVAVNCLKFVIKHIDYVPDLENPKTLAIEKWQSPLETWATKQGDCEDGALLLSSLLLVCGINPYQILIKCGDVVSPKNAQATEGHCWMEYLPMLDGVPRILDWCYWPNNLAMQNRLFAVAEQKYPGPIWFAFNNIRYFGRYAFK